jgi:hypothetical protein
LNEILSPPPATLVVIVIALNDNAETIEAFSKREALEFTNLLGGGLG